MVNATCAGAEPATLNVIKAVTNDNGGSATASSFNLYVKLDGANVVGSPAAGAATPGTSYSLDAGTYVVSEDINALYTQSFSGDCDAGGNVTLAPGDDKTCTITNNDIPATINVVKTVINDDGGNSSVGDFPLFVNSTSVVSGVTNTFAAPASYTVSETADSDYTQVFSGDCDANGVINLVPGDNKFCIITNNDINRPVSGGGGFITMPDPPLIDVIKVPSPLALPGGPGLVEYTYTVKNIGTVPMIDVTLVGDSCSPIILTSGDSNFNQRLEVTETWVYTCSTTLTETHTNNVVATGWHYGLSSVDIASATVIVGLPVVPPLIHVTKVPSPLSLLAGGGMVTYTKQVTNPGTVPLSNVRLTDDVCNPVVYISGDANGDSLLDPAETWVYTCSVNLNQTTVNTVIASGDANGLTARDIAVATVVVAGAVVVPQLPDTGFFTRSGITLWNIVILGSVALALAALGLYRKRQV
ncbi:MAG: hypothetical protein Q8P32_02790 [Candidatus Komeilibacteria bacterium]|nr:hypothetical protein [Candidatus Komeilibacteria bacterium]